MFLLLPSFKCVNNVISILYRILKLDQFVTYRNFPHHRFDIQLASETWRQFHHHHFLFMFVQLNQFDESRRNNVENTLTLLIGYIIFE